MRVIRKLAEIDPWSAEQLERETAGARETFAKLPPPQGEWVGPIGDPWLETWKDVDHLQMCALDVLRADPTGDELLHDEDVHGAILGAAESEHQILSRVGKPLAERLGLA